LFRTACRERQVFWRSVTRIESISTAGSPEKTYYYPFFSALWEWWLSGLPPPPEMPLFD
jgi:hypothetical protein